MVETIFFFIPIIIIAFLGAYALVNYDKFDKYDIALELIGFFVCAIYYIIYFRALLFY